MAPHRDQGAAGAGRDSAVDEPADRLRGRVRLRCDLHLDLDQSAIGGRHATDGEQCGHTHADHHHGATAYAADPLEQPTAEQ